MCRKEKDRPWNNPRAHLTRWIRFPIAHSPRFPIARPCTRHRKPRRVSESVLFTMGITFAHGSNNSHKICNRQLNRFGTFAGFRTSNLKITPPSSIFLHRQHAPRTSPAFHTYHLDAAPLHTLQTALACQSYPLGIQPRVESLQSSYTGLYPQTPRACLSCCSHLTECIHDKVLESRLPQKFANLSFIISDIKDKLTDSCGT